MKNFQLLALSLACLACLAACSAPGATGESTSITPAAELAFAMPPNTNVMEPGMCPTPYTAEQIRAANPPGSWKLYRIVADGRTMLQRFEFVEARDKSLAALNVAMSDENGKVLGTERTPPASWKELQAHASFNASGTLMGRDRIALKAGEFDCWTYAVDGKDGAVSYFWFATELPGPPVLLETRVNGKPTLRMELEARGEAESTATSMKLDAEDVPAEVWDARDRYLALGEADEWRSLREQPEVSYGLPEFLFEGFARFTATRVNR